MLILAIDTCDARGSVALLRDENCLHVVSHVDSQDYSGWLLPAVDAVLVAADCKISDVNVFAAACGPGSFTGVRVGLTAVKAWAEVYNRGIAGVSRLHALATQATRQRGWVASFIDAHRSQIFGGLYRRNGAELEPAEPEVVIDPSEFVEWVGSHVRAEEVEWISPDPGCVARAAAWPARQQAGEAVQLGPSLLAPAIGRLGFQLAVAGKLVDAFALDANYVRRPDAEVFWKPKSSAPTSPDK